MFYLKLKLTGDTIRSGSVVVVDDTDCSVITIALLKFCERKFSLVAKQPFSILGINKSKIFRSSRAENFHTVIMIL